MKKEKILEITECTFKHNDDSYDGYIFKTTQQEIKVGINNQQYCCENWGYFMSEDNISHYIGSYLQGIKITDTALNTHKMNELDLYEGGVMFIDFITNKCILQFVAYNEHYGYYGHDAIVISNQLNTKLIL